MVDEVAEESEEIPAKSDELAATIRENLDTDDEAEAFCGWILSQSNADSWDEMADAGAKQWLSTIEGKTDPGDWMQSKITDAAAE
jgi:hypothetical protein